MVFSLLKRTATAVFCSVLAVTQFSAPALAAGAPTTGELHLPSLGTVAGADLSILEERQLGEELMQRVRADKSFMNDEETTDYLNRLGYRLIAAGSAPAYDFFFFPIRDKSLNAFALPGGFIAVHSGLVVAARTESELAGVMGHEIGHVTQRHIARMLEQGKSSLAMTLGSLLLALLAARAGGSSGGDAAMAITMGTQAALIQNQLGYSRDAEREADRVGLNSLSRAGFDPKGMEDFFGRLQQNNRFYETASNAYLSTHPLTTERISDMQNRTRTMQGVNVASSLDFLLIQARLRVLQETRYDGWLKVAEHFDNDRKTVQWAKAVAVAYGQSVAMQRMNQPEKALAYAREAVALAKSPNVLLDKNLSQAIFSCAKTPTQKNEALKVAQQTASRWPYSRLAASNYTELLYQAARHADVVKYLRTQKALTRYDPDYHAYLARSYEALGQKTLAYASTGDMYALMDNSKAAVYQYELAQRAADADFYVMSEVDAKLREQRRKVLDEQKK